MFFRALNKDSAGKKSWLCFGNMFLKVPNDKAKTLLKSGKRICI